MLLPTKFRVEGAGVPQSPPGFSQTFPQLWLTVQNQAAFTGNEMAKGQFTTFLKFCQQKDISKAGNADSIEWFLFFRNRGSGIIRNGVSSGKPAPAVAVPSASSSTVKSSVNNRIYSGTGIRVPGHHGHTGRLLSEVDEEIEQNGGEENRPTRPRLSSSSFPTNCQRSR